jgi:hypothetical protein
MLDENELKFGDLLVEKGYHVLYMFLEYYPRTLSIKLLKIPSDIYIPSVPVWKPDFESFMRSNYVRDHRIFRPISYMDYANPDQIKKHNDKANHYLNLGNWLYNCSLYPIDEWSGSDGAQRDALKFKHACDSLDALRRCTTIFVGGRNCGKTELAKQLARQLLNSNYGLASADNWAQRYLYTTDKLYDTLGIKDYLNKVYGDPMLKFKNGLDVYIEWVPTGSKSLKELAKEYCCDLDFERMKLWNVENIIEDIKREEETNKMADKRQVYVFRFKDLESKYYEISLEKDFKNEMYPYHARVYTRKTALSTEEGADNKFFTVTFGYRYWEQLETQLLYDLSGHGIVVQKDCRDEITTELHRAKILFRGYSNFDSPFQGGYTASKSERTLPPFTAMPKIEKVIFNPPATIVQWKDGTKTVVKCQDGDNFDWEKGLAMAYVKRAYNNERTYYGLFKKNRASWNSCVNGIEFHALYDPMVAKEVRIIVPKDLPVTGDIIKKAYDLIVTEGDKMFEAGVEVHQ